jgi:hypothetical protein
VDEIEFEKLTSGRIVWANLPDSQGNDCGEHRFVIVVPPTAPITAASELWVIGISTRRPEKESKDDCVKLKYENRPGGHPKTKLTSECWAHCGWAHICAVGELRDRSGVVGEAEMKQIRDIFERMRSTEGDKTS